MSRTREEHSASRHMAARVQTIEAAIQEADIILSRLGVDILPTISDSHRDLMTELVNDARANLAIALRAITGED